MDLAQIVGGNVRRLRLYRGLTQEDLAHRAEISVRFLSGIEHGRENITLAVIERLSRALGETPDSLLGTPA
jgi:transcriptional regulator with XRE-family HTH domain